MFATVSLTPLNFKDLSDNTFDPSTKNSPLARLNEFHVSLIAHHKTLENGSALQLTTGAAKNSVASLKQSSEAIKEYLKNGPLAEVSGLQAVDYKKEIDIYDRKNNLKKAKWVFLEYAKIIHDVSFNYSHYAARRPINPELLPANVEERMVVFERLAFSLDQNPQQWKSLLTLLSLIMAVSALVFAKMYIGVSSN